MNPFIAQSFYITFMIPAIQDLFVVLTDRLHKSGFKQFFHITQLGQVTVPLSGNNGVTDNAAFLRYVEVSGDCLRQWLIRRVDGSHWVPSNNTSATSSSM
eukprot:gene13996-15459_t